MDVLSVLHDFLSIFGIYFDRFIHENNTIFTETATEVRCRYVGAGIQNVHHRKHMLDVGEWPWVKRDRAIDRLPVWVGVFFLGACGPGRTYLLAVFLRNGINSLCSLQYSSRPQLKQSLSFGQGQGSYVLDMRLLQIVFRAQTGQTHGMDIL